MFSEDYTAAANAAAAKSALLKKNPGGYFLLSVLAGMFIGFGVLLVFTLSGAMAGSPFTKLVMGCTFSVALSLVVIAGAELFTGNNMVMTAGLLRKTVTASDVIRLWAVCWLGNLAGSVLLAGTYYLTGLYSGATLTAMTDAAAAKMTAGFVPLLARGMLCNTLVCLAVWCGMTLLTLSLMNSGGNEAISMGGYWFNLLTVTAGNMIGAILFVALPYHAASIER